MAPEAERLPFPWLALAAVAGLLAHVGFAQVSLNLVTQFKTYIRPGVCDMIRIKQLVWPTTQGAHQVYQWWGLVLHPAEDQVPSKTGRFDDAIWMDLDSWIGPLLAKLTHHRLPHSFLWPFAPRGIIHLFREACKLLHLLVLRPCRHALRHGGASDDLITKRRTLGEVKRMGCWASDASLVRYGKETALLQQLNKVKPEVLDYGARVAPLLPMILNGEMPAPLPPVSRQALEKLAQFTLPMR